MLIIEARSDSLALHEQCLGKTDEWYTPPHIFNAMSAKFDLDVASPGEEVTPWIPAGAFLKAGSLAAPWGGYIWMNPPFGGRNGLMPWLEKFTQHGNGIALVPDRTSAPWWQHFAPKMHAILFVRKKIKFIGQDGRPGNSPAQGTCLFGLGERALEDLRNAAINNLGFLMQPL